MSVRKSESEKLDMAKTSDSKVRVSNSTKGDPIPPLRPSDLAVLSSQTSRMLLNSPDSKKLRMTDPDPEKDGAVYDRIFQCCLKSPNLPAVKKVDLAWTFMPRTEEPIKMGKVKQIVQNLQMFGGGPTPPSTPSMEAKSQ